MPKISTRDSHLIREKCIDRETFSTHGALHGNKVNHWSAHMMLSRPGCQLPAEYAESYYISEYAVYSYNTPIAWYGPEGWVMPDEKYSVTTSRHQGRLWFVRDWIKQQGE